MLVSSAGAAAARLRRNLVLELNHPLVAFASTDAGALLRAAQRARGWGGWGVQLARASRPSSPLARAPSACPPPAGTATNYSALRVPLPRNVHLLSLNSDDSAGFVPDPDPLPRASGPATSVSAPAAVSRPVLLRLQHLYAVGEDPGLSQPIQASSRAAEPRLVAHLAPTSPAGCCCLRAVSPPDSSIWAASSPRRWCSPT